MRLLDGLRTRLALLRRRSSDERFDEEIAFHIDMEAARLEREERLAPADARRRALVAFGGVQDHKESLRDGRGLRWLGGLALDLRLGVRMMAKWPGLTLVGILGMAVAITVGTVSFGIIRTFIGTTPPIDEGNRLVMIENWDSRTNGERAASHLHDLPHWRSGIGAVAEMGAYRIVDRNLIARGARPEPVAVAEMTASGFRIARVAPLMGRTLLDEDERPGTRAVVVIAHETWQERFAGDPDVIGRIIQLGATPHTIVGVMPPGFAFPVNNRIWTPLRLDPLQYAEGQAPGIKVFGRLAAGASVDDANRQAAAVSARLLETRTEPLRHLRANAIPYGRAFAENPGFAWVMRLVQVAISLLLVVIGINVATLVYARTAGRMGEIAVRTALGASRRRIVAGLFTEAFVLSVLSAVIGLIAALLILRNLETYVHRLASNVPYWWSFGLSYGMAAYVFGLALLAAVVVGAIPALKATGKDVRANLQQLGAGGGGMRLGRSWTVLIVTQVVVAVTMLPIVVQVALMTRRADPTDGPSYATHEWVTAAVHLDQDGAGALASPDSIVRQRYVAREGELVRRLRGDSRVADAVLMSGVPGNEGQLRVDVEPSPRATSLRQRIATGESQLTATVAVEPAFFRAFGIPVLSGRALERGDVTAGSNAIVVNQPFIEQVLGGGDALGRRVRIASQSVDENGATRAGEPWCEIVGVIPDFPAVGGADERHAVMYLAMHPDSVRTAIVAVRARGAAQPSFAGTLREIAVGVDPMLRLEEVRSINDAISLEAAMDRLIFGGIMALALSVLLLSAAGIYALMSFTIARRRREIGIRAALGAGARQTVSAVLSRASAQVGIGIVVGLSLAAFLTHQLRDGVWETRTVLVMVGVAGFMSLVGIVAAWGPVRAALRIQPTEALRSD